MRVAFVFTCVLFNFNPEEIRPIFPLDQLSELTLQLSDNVARHWQIVTTLTLGCLSLGFYHYYKQYAYQRKFLKLKNNLSSTIESQRVFLQSHPTFNSVLGDANRFNKATIKRKFVENLSLSVDIQPLIDYYKSLLVEEKKILIHLRNFRNYLSEQPDGKNLRELMRDRSQLLPHRLNAVDFLVTTMTEFLSGSDLRRAEPNPKF